MEGDTERSGVVIDSAITVHSALGSGLLERAYLVCLTYELRSRGLHVLTQVPLPVTTFATGHGGGAFR